MPCERKGMAKERSEALRQRRYPCVTPCCNDSGYWGKEWRQRSKAIGLARHSKLGELECIEPTFRRSRSERLMWGKKIE